jgi:hypothetical protein
MWEFDFCVKFNARPLDEKERVMIMGVLFKAVEVGMMSASKYMIALKRKPCSRLLGREEKGRPQPLVVRVTAVYHEDRPRIS